MVGELGPFWVLLPLPLQREIVEWTLPKRNAFMVEALRMITQLRNGRVDSPIRHLDWHPCYMGMNIFFIPPHCYDSFPAEARLLLAFMVRNGTVGVVFHMTRLAACVAKWEANGETVTRLGSWLSSFLTISEWNTFLQQEWVGEYMLFTFHIEQATDYWDDELVVIERSQVVFEGSWPTNPAIQPEDEPVRWAEMKRLLMVLNNIEHDPISTVLQSADNYYCDGRIKESTGILSEVQIENTFYLEAESNQAVFRDVNFRRSFGIPLYGAGSFIRNGEGSG